MFIVVSNELILISEITTYDKSFIPTSIFYYFSGSASDIQVLHFWFGDNNGTSKDFLKTRVSGMEIHIY